MSATKDLVRYPYLSALRGLAALWVVLAHVELAPKGKFLLPGWLHVFVSNGGMGVPLFFLVSAFSLCLTMPKHHNEDRPYLGFMLRRFFRIAPLFYVMIIAILATGAAYDWTAVVANVLFVFNFIPGFGYQTSVVAAGWTIGVEMIFYLVFPFVYARTKGIVPAVVALVIALVISKVFILGVERFMPDDPYMRLMSVFYAAPHFMFGIIAFYVVRSAEHWKNKRVIGAVLLASVPVQFCLIVSGMVPFLEPYYWLGLMFGCLLVGLFLFPIRLLVNAATIWLGNISYSIYLVHGPIIAGLFWTRRPLKDLGLGQVETYSLALVWTLVLVIPMAMVTFYLWENPINEWGKRFASRVAGRKRRVLIENEAKPELTFAA